MKKTLAIMLALIMVVCLVPTVAFADGAAIYVSSSGYDTNNGTEASPYATLAKAVDAAPSGATIYVMSDLTMTESARFWDKHLTITSGEGDPYTITRGIIDTVSDKARGSYNPAMIEVQTSDSSASLTLTNIILDDNRNHAGTVFAQAISGEGHGDNTVYVQDAIVASNATKDCTITLGEGAVLRNFGGMSAVRVTDQAKLVMESGSVIEDNLVSKRTKGSAAGEVGPAGAVWIQSAAFEMEDGAKIQNVDGRAVYVDGGNVTVGGTISGITGNSNMWQGEQGVAIHLRNHANVIFTSTCKIGLPGNNEGIYGDGEATSILVELSELNMESNSVIQNVNMPKGSVIRLLGSKLTMENNSAILDSDAEGIQSTNEGYAKAPRNTIEMNGEIARIGTKNNHHNPIKLAVSTLTIGEMGSIHNNFSSYGALYVQKDATVDIYGKIYNNNSSDRGGGIGTPGHGSVTITLHEGAEITGNISQKTGGGASLKNCTFIMEGGTISNNASGDVGGGIYLNEKSNVQIKGGTISDNIMKATITIDEQTGIYSATDGKPNDLTIGNNEKTYGPIYSLYISDKANVGNKAVYFQKDDKTITPADDSFNIKFGNASGDSIDALKTASNDKGWSDPPLATFWTQRDNAATMTVGGLTINPNNPIVYALMYKTDEAGNHTGELVVCTTTVEGDNVTLTVPGSKNGFAVALVQPTKDFGNVVITGPAEINEDPAAYEIPYKATYTMSRSFISTLKTLAQNLAGDNGTGIELKFVVQLDNRLTAKKDANGKFIYTFNGAGVLETDENGIEVSADEHTITVPCKLKDGWKDAIKDNIVMTLDGTGVLQANDFTSGGVLGTTGNIQAILPIQGEIINVLIPANVCQTKMVGSTPTPPPSADPSPTPGGGNGGGYHYPTTTPVPVIVIPPKTGDMTVWQSILNFLGIK